MASLHFMHPEFLVFLLSLPLIFVTHYYLFHFTKKKALHFGNFATLKRVTGKKLLTRNTGVLVLRLLALTCFVLAVSQPVIWYETQTHRSDFVIAIDTSASMTADDLLPTRFEAAKQAANLLVDDLNTSVRIGVIGFSGLTTVEQTLTTNKEELHDAITGMKLETVSGTDLSQAIITGTNLLVGSPRARTILLFTDGSTTVGASENDPVFRGVQYAKDHRVVVHTIGLGSESNSLVGYLPQLYNVSAVYDEDTLAYIANQTTGVFVSASDEDELEEAYKQFLGSSTPGFVSQELHVGLLLIGLLLLFIEWGAINTRFRLIP